MVKGWKKGVFGADNGFLAVRLTVTLEIFRI